LKAPLSEATTESTLSRKTVTDDPRELARLDFWFFASFLKTRDESTNQITDFPTPEEYPYLAEIFGEIERYRKIPIHKARQMFMSWFLQAYMLWKANCCKNSEAWFGATVAHREDDAIRLLDRAWFMYNYLPDWLKSELVRKSTTEIHFSSGVIGKDGKPIAKSGLDALPANPYIGRSRTYSFFNFEEIAFVPEDEEMLASVEPTVAEGGTKLVMPSTGNGRANAFARIVEQPQPEHYTRILKIDWRRHPHRDEAWKARRIEELAATFGSWEKAKEVFAVEYELSLEGKEGLIYDGFDDRLHVCEDFDIPNAWPCGVYIDPHAAKPTAILLVAISPEQVLYACDSVWAAENVNGLMSRARSKWALKHITQWLIDPHSDNNNNLAPNQFNAYRAFREQIPDLQPAPGTPEGRIEAVRRALALRPLTGRPGLQIFRSQVRLLWEIRHYATKRPKQNPAGDPIIVKNDDDFVDCLGYACVSPPVFMQYERKKEPQPFRMGLAEMRR